VGEEEKHTYCSYAYRLNFLTCDMYKSSLRHIHDPVLSSLKMKGILSFLLVFNFVFINISLYTVLPSVFLVILFVDFPEDCCSIHDLLFFCLPLY
jgi:hypothetical protein